MKKTKILLLSLFVLFVSVACAEDDKRIATSELPTAAQQFIKKYFAKKKVALAKVDKELTSTTYEVVFTDGATVDFNSKGQWYDIECRKESVPSALVPSQITTYVKANYSGRPIVKLEKQRRGGYEVELSDGLELKFDKNYKLVDLDR